MNIDDVINQIRKVQNKINPIVPGMNERVDMVLVFHPDTLKKLQEQLKPYEIEGAKPTGLAQSIAGYRVFVESDAPRENIEFMSYITYLFRYKTKKDSPFDPKLEE